MAQRTKVLLLIPHLGGGGAEQVTALLARGLSRERYEVHLGLVTQPAAGPGSLPPWVVRRLKPDVILSGMAHLNFLVLLLRPLFPSATRVLVRQNGTVSAALAFGDLPAYTRLLYRLLYRHADRVICQTQAMATDLAGEIKIHHWRLAVLPNPVDVDGIRSACVESPSSWTGPGPHLLAVGRLAPVKGFDLLLRALAAVHEQFPSADLLLAGAGPEEAALKALAVELGFQKSVRFAGHIDQPAAYFPGATLFVLSSRHEGLPNVLLEAAAGGLPMVALPASRGVVDLLRDQPGVWLAPEISAEALASSLLAALRALRQGQRFPHLFVEQFALRRSIQGYEQLIDATIRERQP
jgi:glycosyltransferase involved in cell wall biosynthesis